MGMYLSTYVGPYFVVPKSGISSNDLWHWDSLLLDGRGESGVNESDWVLVPSLKLPGIFREMRVEVHGNQDVANIDPEDITREKDVFAAMAAEFLMWCTIQSIPCQRRWGVVPCWS